LSPAYAIVEYKGSRISYKDYGKTLRELGVQSNDIFRVSLNQEFSSSQEPIA